MRITQEQDHTTGQRYWLATQRRAQDGRLCMAEGRSWSDAAAKAAHLAGMTAGETDAEIRRTVRLLNREQAQ